MFKSMSNVSSSNDFAINALMAKMAKSAIIRLNQETNDIQVPIWFVLAMANYERTPSLNLEVELVDNDNIELGHWYSDYDLEQPIWVRAQDVDVKAPQLESYKSTSQSSGWISYDFSAYSADTMEYMAAKMAVSSHRRGQHFLAYCECGWNEQELATQGSEYNYQQFVSLDDTSPEWGDDEGSDAQPPMGDEFTRWDERRSRPYWVRAQESRSSSRRKGRRD